MPKDLPGRLSSGKVYLIKGDTWNMLLDAIGSRTPLPQDPLTGEDDDINGVKITAQHVPIVVCVDDGEGGFRERRMDVMGSPAEEQA